jgi:hemolysin III
MTARAYASREEFAHSATHGAGVVASIVGIAALVLTAALHGDVWRLVGGTVFGLTALLLFATSTLYHAARDPKAKKLLRRLDHSAIYLLIAGTYTAFAIGVMRGSWGWTLFGITWAAAILGIAMELSAGIHKPIRSSLLYVALGWVGVIAIKQLMSDLTSFQLTWVVAGGVLYTCGVPFYVWKSRAYTHVIWHLFVLGGVGCHFVAVLSIMRAVPQY